MISIKSPFFFFFFSSADKKTKVHCYIKWITIPVPKFLLGTDNKGSCLSKSSSWISCSVIFIFAFRHERLKSLPSWNWKQTPASRVLGACTITAAKTRWQRQNKYTKTLEFCDCLKRFLQTFFWIFLILGVGGSFCKRPWLRSESLYVLLKLVTDFFCQFLYRT